MWGQRYGLTASVRSEGGHRRYTGDDVDRLRRMHEAVTSGVNPSAAAAAVLSRRVARARPSRPGGPGGAVLAVPGAGREARGIARAASRLDEMTVEDAVLDGLRQKGTLAAWEEIVRPVLVSAGEHLQRSGAGIEIEHLLTQAVTTAFVRHVAALPTESIQDNPALLAGGPSEEHVIALHAVRAALAERGVPARLLGPRTPMAALATAARRTRAAGVLVWLSLPDREAAKGLSTVRAAHRRLILLIGGPGWDGLPTQPATRCESLLESVDLLEKAWTGR